jgi:acylphosphatase
VSEDTQQLHAYIRGRVQGVGFRDHITSAARRSNLTGWVRNLDDGRVEVVAEGPRSVLESLIPTLEQGPPADRVEGVDVNWRPAQNRFTSFQRRTD